MAIKLTRDLLISLRNDLANSIATYKAYEVPAVCKRVGLADGTDAEAFTSKFKYAERRIIALSDTQLQESAKQIYDELGDYSLGETIAKASDLTRRPVTSLTRRRIIKLFENQPLITEINEIDFLRSVWPIAKMPYPSNGYFNCIEEFLIQHTVRNDDLTQQEVLETLGILSCSTSQLFKFLEAVTSAEFQTELRQGELANSIDDLLRHDGYRLLETSKISGSPVFRVREVSSDSPANQENSKKIQIFEPSQISPRWQAALDSRSADPERAITLARTLLEDVCKWILHEAREEWDETDDLPALYKKLAKILNLAPDDHTEQIFKQILSGCQSVISALGALRNKLGDAHSIGPKRVRPAERHAQLAVSLAGTMATFLISTWEANFAKD